MNNTKKSIWVISGSFLFLLIFSMASASEDSASKQYVMRCISANGFDSWTGEVNKDFAASREEGKYTRFSEGLLAVWGSRIGNEVGKDGWRLSAAAATLGATVCFSKAVE